MEHLKRAIQNKMKWYLLILIKEGYKLQWKNQINNGLNQEFSKYAPTTTTTSVSTGNLFKIQILKPLSRPIESKTRIKAQESEF